MWDRRFFSKFVTIDLGQTFEYRCWREAEIDQLVSFDSLSLAYQLFAMKNEMIDEETLVRPLTFPPPQSLLVACIIDL